MTASSAAALEFLYNLQKSGIKLGLDTIRALLDRVGRPEKSYRALHIGGTNGKGSTAAMAASVLLSAGYRVGLYTSPHLVDFRERIRLDGAPIPEECLVELTTRLRKAAGPTLSPTFFEFTTAMALCYFADSQVDLAVLEVGMGGRFDATNVVVPFVSAITNVSLDHQEYLGDRLELIAFEKAGIIKPHVPLVVGPLEPVVERVIAHEAARQGAIVSRYGVDFRCEGDDPARFGYYGRSVTYPELFCPLGGAHQIENAACALAMMEVARTAGVQVPTPAIQEGLRGVTWEGRLEIADTHPVLLMDGAHNPGAAQVVARYLARYRRDHPECRIILLVGMMRDKDRKEFMRTILPAVDEVVLTEPSLPRAASVEELRAAVGEDVRPIHEAPLPTEALACARRIARVDDLICVTGSLMLVGQLKALLRGCRPSLLRG